MLVLALSLDVEVHLCRITQTLEEMLEHLCWHFAHLLSVELCIPDQPWTATEIQCHLTETIIHRQRVTISLYATLVAQRLQQAFAQGDTRIFYGVMLIHIEVALGVDGEVHHAVLAYLFQHVVEETKTGRNVAFAAAIKIYLDVDIRLLGGALHFCDAVAGKENLGYLVPVHAVFSENQTLATQVLGKLGIGFTVADYITVCHIVGWVVDIFGQHARARLSHRRVILREVAVDVLLGEVDALALQGLDDEVVYWPEGVLREGVGAQSVLVAHHHQLVVGVLGNEGEVAEYALGEYQLLEAVNLFVRRFLNQGSVAVDEE